MIEAPSRVVRVRVFEDRAEVERRAEVTLPAGVAWVEVGGVALTVDDLSVVASCVTGGRVVASRVLRRTRSDANPTEVAAHEAEEIVAADELRLAAAARNRAAAEVERVGAAGDALAGTLARPPRDFAVEANRARWTQAWREVDVARLHALAAVAAAEEAHAAAVRAHAFAAARLVAARQQTPRYEASLRIQVDAAGGPIELRVVYRVAAALWRPQHQARLVGGELVWRLAATVWQRTGEDWRDVACELSTARPAKDASVPLVAEDLVTLTKKQDRAVHVEARDEVIATAGLDRGQREVADMPGVDDGGEPQIFRATRPVSIAADGAPFTVELGESRLPCVVETVLMPERAPTAHIRATGTWKGTTPLLAGPVQLGREGSLVGRSRIGFVGQGEPFELGFGADDAVRVRRRVDTERDTGMLGTQKISHQVSIYLSNLAGDARKLLVVERVPKSELADLKIEVTAAGGATVDDKDGFLRWQLELGANETKKLVFAYRIEAAAKVVLGAL